MELDKEQQEVVDYTGSTLVIAGPGSGKTRTLVAKVEKLYASNADIICLTFTRTAAQELRDRMPGIQAMTIHSYCCQTVGWGGGYETLLQNTITKKWKEKYEWVCVDEVQDLTEEQWQVVEGLVGGKLFAVGDPYQSIYGWNEALGLEILDYLSAKGCERFDLKNNYRSSERIVTLLNKRFPRGLVSAGVKSTGLTAVLCRSRQLVREVANLLTENAVGYTVRLSTSELEDGAKEELRGDSNLKVMTCHCSKGLEFDKVILYKWDPSILLSGEEERLFYVSLSRASKQFCQVSNPRQLLGVLNEET